MAIKPVTLSDTATVVSKYDPAAVPDADWGAYSEKALESCHRDLIQTRDGEELTEFVIGVISSSRMAQIMDSARSKDSVRVCEMWNECFLYGVREIRNWEGSETPTMHKVGEIEYVDPKWLAANFAKGLWQVAQDIGIHVLSFNSLTENEVKN